MQVVAFIVAFVTVALIGLAGAAPLPHGIAYSYALVAHSFAPQHGNYISYPPNDSHDQHSQYGQHHHPKHAFEYGVKDALSGDYKRQWEQRDGNKVSGGYALQEADGSIRVVEYTADAKNGFQANVKHVGQAQYGYDHAGSY